jgi:hypothetical protein
MSSGCTTLKRSCNVHSLVNRESPNKIVELFRVSLVPRVIGDALLYRPQNRISLVPSRQGMVIARWPAPGLVDTRLS